MKDGDILITAEEVNKHLPPGLEIEKDIKAHDYETIPPDNYMNAVALASKNGKRRLSKKDSQQIVQVLEMATGYSWYVDGIGNFVIHLEREEIPVEE